MKIPDLRLHPITIVPLWLASIGDGWEAQFSRYTYVPQSLADHREIFQVPLSQVDSAWLTEELYRLSPDQELALHSCLSKGRRVRHLPMADFLLPGHAASQLALWATEHLGAKFELFSSGRSFHGYGLTPVSPSEWVRLMGLLLLGNLPDREPVVDTRWVGHRLLAGYSSLRWSNNNPHYIGWPTRVSVPPSE